MADTLAIQQTAHVIDRAGKLAFHSKRQHLTPMDVVAASGEQGYGGAALPQLLHVPDADLLYRFEADLSASEVCRRPGCSFGALVPLRAPLCLAAPPPAPPPPRPPHTHLLPTSHAPCRRYVPNSCPLHHSRWALLSIGWQWTACSPPQLRMHSRGAPLLLLPAAAHMVQFRAEGQFLRRCRALVAVRWLVAQHRHWSLQAALRPGCR